MYLTFKITKNFLFLKVTTIFAENCSFLPITIIKSILKYRSFFLLDISSIKIVSLNVSFFHLPFSAHYNTSLTFSHLQKISTTDNVYIIKIDEAKKHSFSFIRKIIIYLYYQKENIKTCFYL